MNIRIRRLPISFLSFFCLAAFFTFCTPSGTNESTKTIEPIKTAEIIAFQKAYGVSFNAISEAIEQDSYYETAAQKHITQNYNFDEGKVMFKIGHDDDEQYRYTKQGVLSYLIGKNNDYPNDTGIAKANWRKHEWKNDGIINDDSGIAIAMGKVEMTNDEGEKTIQNYTMCLKRNSKGDLKLIAHKIAKPCI